MNSKPALNKRKITHGSEERIKMTRLRMTIAKRLKEAQDNAAMLTTFNEVDMFEVIQMRKNYGEEFKKKWVGPMRGTHFCFLFWKIVPPRAPQGAPKSIKKIDKMWS